MAKILCSFPKNYKLIGSYITQWARLGNAVMPNMMKAIAENVKINILDKFYNSEVTR
jgi:site-specific DNA-cytosine methylase